MKNSNKKMAQSHSQRDKAHQANNDLLPQEEINTTLEFTEEEIESLIYMYQEEKLAMDVYDSFAEEYDVKIFDKISDSEEKHMGAVENLLIQANVDIEELQSLEEGVFLNDGLQYLYDTLSVQGSGSLTEALNVGVLIEEADIYDLNAYLQGDINENIDALYNNLEVGSENHLAAFSAQLDNLLI